jgi:spore germination protein KC
MKKLWIGILAICELFFLTACWDRYELEERANILGLAIDLMEDFNEEDVPDVAHIKEDFPAKDRDDIYRVTAQLAVPGKIKLGPESGGENSDKTAWVLETYGYTLRAAIESLQQQLAEKLYLGHLQIIVISEAVASRGVEEINDFLRRNYEVRRTAWLVVNQQNAAEVLTVAPPKETVPSLYLADTLDNAVRFGKLPRVYLGKFWIDISDEGMSPIIPAVRVINGDRIMVDGLAYFAGDKMVGRTTPIEIGTYMALKQKHSGGYTIAVSLDEKEDVFMVKSNLRNSKIRVDVKDGKPRASIDVSIDAIIEEKVNSVDLEEDILRKVEDKAREKVEQLGNQLLAKLQAAKSDVLGIGARIMALHSDYWDKEIKTSENWREVYKNMEIKLQVNYHVERTGIDWR